jgi:hypothetical protein
MQTARALGIKYSTAKTLIRNYSQTFHTEYPELVRTACQEFATHAGSSRRCGYAAISASVGLREGGGRSDGV